MASVIDFHTHVFPEPVREELQNESSSAQVSAEKDDQGNLLVRYPGRSFRFPRSIYRIEDRKVDMKKIGIDMQVISQSGPWTDIFSPAVSVKLCRIINDWLSDVVKDDRNSFLGLGTVPMQDPQAAVAELNHAHEIGLKGVIIGSNVNGKYLDASDFTQFFESCEKLGLVIFIHPAEPNPWKAQEYGLTVTLSFPYETTVTLTRLVLAGVLERFPKLKIVAAHAGGMLPFIQGRVDRAHQWMSEAKGKIDKPPSYYFRQLYADALCFNKDSLLLATKFFGENHVVFGSDYPFPWGADLALSLLKSCGFEPSVEAKIMNENAAELLGL